MLNMSLLTATRRLSSLSSTITRGFAFSSAAKTDGINSLAVIGAGQMGLGIALVAARNAGVNVFLHDNSQQSLDKSIKFMDKLLEKDFSKGRLSSDQVGTIKSLIKASTSLESIIPQVDMVIEAVPEIPKLKEEIFAKLAALAGRNTILATNTSSISITRIAAAAKTAEDRVISAHFMNPVPVQKGVEIICGLQTSKTTLDRTLLFVTRMGKIPSVSKDTPGFLANRILLPYLNEAICAYEAGIGSAEDIDNIMVNGCAMPMGPLKLADFIGLDTCLSIMKVLYEDTCDSKYRPSILLSRMVDAGYLGKKSGKGFYEYNE
ncbi:hypothetical protein NADFUDRAFT_82110 [Nadsonia fulvescens var. elongata DSM 6958]|uniref:3-hydroxybutyryl-CoA dehydrogenase n=1 Tax=Nadsonia fulvescens var. elongata DSM 6958 TaxID=857566 RepID=A0A1E3PL99_9ASCO|nr:hypothetical protein NADFUDRAFT_82110 [Nadsonia fulvescens var. elongata DSM 6958]